MPSALPQTVRFSIFAPLTQPNSALSLPSLQARRPVILCPCPSNVPRNARLMLVPMGVQDRCAPLALSRSSERSAPNLSVTPEKSVPPLTSTASPASCSAVVMV